jgi:hypothetical protein
MNDGATIAGIPLGFAMAYTLWLLSVPVPYLCARLGWQAPDTVLIHLTGLLLGFGLIGIGLPQGGAVAWLVGCTGYTVVMLGGFLRWAAQSERVA